MASERFGQLVQQLQVLRDSLLPEGFDPTGTYDRPDKVETGALAYRVLAHAEIEAYFEDRSLEVVVAASSAWDQRSHVSRVVLCLLAFSGKEMSFPPDTLEAPSENKRKNWLAQVDIRERLSPVISSFHRLVRQSNHGVRESNILALLLPIGIEHSRIDPTFLAEIDSFGSLRGLAAHTSSRPSVRQAVDPEQELKRVDALKPGLEAIDKLIDELLDGLPNRPENSPKQVVLQDL
jgi:hypothetical protein